jgi:hypothetical protein
VAAQLGIAAIVLGVLVALLIVTSRRYGRPRSYMRPVVALWVVAVLMAAILVWLALT